VRTSEQFKVPATVLPSIGRNENGPEDVRILPVLPSGWLWVRLRDIAELSGGITKGQKRRANDTMRRVPYLRVANVQRGYLDLSDIKEIEATENEIEGLRCSPETSCSTKVETGTNLVEAGSGTAN
jgi:hypothetical protein